MALLLGSAAFAQTEQPTADTATADVATDSTETSEAASADDLALLTEAELQTLVAPVALYPDTLLIQILVAATLPLEVIKSDRFLDDNAEATPEALQTDIEAQGWDPSVAVLATAFPDVIGDMAEHIDWTETMGNAMLAQDEDVLDAVQVMRNQAINTGALISGEAQTVEVAEDDSVVITPTDPEVVYVPQYAPTEVYSGTGLDDVLIAGAIGFGTYALIDAIFDDDDDWNNYWGCRNCGGWGGGPIVRDPDIDIDIDGNVNIGNEINRPNRPDRPDRNPDGGWKPDPDKSQGAKDKIANKRGDGGATTLPIKKPAKQSDAMRERLSDRTGTADISRPNADRAKIDRAKLDKAKITRPSGGSARADALRKTADKPGARKATAQKKPAAVKRAASPKTPKAKKAGGGKKHSALKKNSSGPKARQASNRGKAGGGGKRKKR